MEENKPRTNGLAIAGFVCSLTIGGIVGLVLSIIGLTQINRSGEQGKGLALAGIIISGVRMFLALLICILYFVGIIALTGSYY